MKDRSTATRSLTSDSRSTKTIVTDRLLKTKRQEDGPTYTIPVSIIDALIEDFENVLIDFEAALSDVDLEIVALGATVDEQLEQEIDAVMNELNAFIKDVNTLAEAVGSAVCVPALFV